MRKLVSDLGAGAYLLMHGYKVIGKEGRSFIFEVPSEASEAFDERNMEYLCSDFHRFDSYLMSLKKIDSNGSK